MLYPKDRIDQGADYYALTLGAGRDGHAFIGGHTMWVGWADKDLRVELRRPSLVLPDRMADIWMSLEWPFCVVNSIDDFVRWYVTGGHALVRKGLAEQVFPKVLDPSPCVRIGELGFTGLSSLPKAIFHRAPTPRIRMAVLKRDEYRCRICGRRAADYTDIELNVHHIRPFAQRGITHEDNLITLCDTCHHGLDPHYEWSLFGLLKSEDTAERDRREYLESVSRYRETVRKLLRERDNSKGRGSPSRRPRKRKRASDQKGHNVGEIERANSPDRGSTP